MEIWKTFLLFGSVVITMTRTISSDPIVSDAYKNAHLDLRSLAAKYVKILQSEIGIGISLLSSTCKKDVILKQFKAEQDLLSAFEAAMEDLRYECTSSPPSVEHASVVVTKANATQQAAMYTCDTGYTYGGGEKKVWCDHNYGTWGLATLQCAECFTNPSTYQGKKSMTQRGIECQRWDSQSPHEHSLKLLYFPEKDVSLAENYCRTPNSHFQEPWCYTTDPSMEWDYCGIPQCNRELENDCGSLQVLTNATPRYSYTSNGARASYVCLALSGFTQNIYCPVSVCTNTGWTAVSISCGEHDCFRNSQEYTGKRNCTVSGRTCQEWRDQFPHDHRHGVSTFPDGSIVNAGNYCRDPDGSGTPWCYTTDPTVRYEVCDVPSCDKFL